MNFAKMKSIKYFLLSLASLLLLCVSFTPTVEANPVRDDANQAAWGNTVIPYCNGEDAEWNPECGLQQWIDTVGEVGGFKRTKIDDEGNTVTLGLSDFIQDIVAYILTFVSLLAVLYIIWAGFQILIGNGEEEKLKKSKTTILYVIIGIVVIWLAWPITIFVISALS